MNQNFQLRQSQVSLFLCPVPLGWRHWTLTSSGKGSKIHWVISRHLPFLTKKKKNHCIWVLRREKVWEHIKLTNSGRYLSFVTCGFSGYWGIGRGKKGQKKKKRGGVVAPERAIAATVTGSLRLVQPVRFMGSFIMLRVFWVFTKWPLNVKISRFRIFARGSFGLEIKTK